MGIHGIIIKFKANLGDKVSRGTTEATDMQLPPPEGATKLDMNAKDSQKDKKVASQLAAELAIARRRSCKSPIPPTRRAPDH